MKFVDDDDDDDDIAHSVKYHYTGMMERLINY